MTSNTRSIGQASPGTGSGEGQMPGPNRVHEDDTSTLMDDEIDTSPKPQRCWSNFQVDTRNTSTVFESWEIISVRPTTERTSFKRILGVNIASTHKVLKDQYTGVRAIPSYSQEELAHMVATAENEWNSKRAGLTFFTKQETYSQNLARRLFELPACLPSKLGALLDCRFVATNKNPCVRRDWKVVMLKTMVGFMTEEEQQVLNGGSWGKRHGEPIQKWLIIIRGQETRRSDKGFGTFSTMTNPWLKVDEGLQGDRRIASEQHEGSED
ncbi:hypothetical protein F4803DRAFT_509310 [Xylaria telfairii]|nr:hypothetical protein F4803DRAFT_509310 [Xylaria telfairii]